MNTKNEFIRIMETQSEIALATSVNNVPNVRIVNFYFDNKSNTLYFATFSDNEKVKEFQANKNIAFSTIPHIGNEHIKARGVVKKSELNIYDVADGFINKIPDYKNTIDQVGEYLELFEINLEIVTVTLDLENTEVISLV